MGQLETPRRDEPGAFRLDGTADSPPPPVRHRAEGTFLDQSSVGRGDREGAARRSPSRRGMDPCRYAPGSRGSRSLSSRSRPRTLMAPARPHIFTIPSGIPFARALSEGVIARSGSDPLTLADALVLVPTRRAARALREIFAEALGGAALLPRIRALGDIDDEEQLFDPSTEDLDAVPPVAPLRRRLLLATLVRGWGEAKHAPVPFAQSLTYAGELARLLDEAVTQNADLAGLTGLVSDSMAARWSEVAQFLDIIAVQWPLLLRAEGTTEPAAARDAKLHALGVELARNPPRAPVIAAGSTGSIPATA